jgi:hypothetical protein
VIGITNPGISEQLSYNTPYTGADEMLLHLYILIEANLAVSVVAFISSSMGYKFVLFQ